MQLGLNQNVIVSQNWFFHSFAVFRTVNEKKTFYLKWSIFVKTVKFISHWSISVNDKTRILVKNCGNSLKCIHKNVILGQNWYCPIFLAIFVLSKKIYVFSKRSIFESHWLFFVCQKHIFIKYGRNSRKFLKFKFVINSDYIIFCILDKSIKLSVRILVSYFLSSL